MVGDDVVFSLALAVYALLCDVQILRVSKILPNFSLLSIFLLVDRVSDRNASEDLLRITMLVLLRRKVLSFEPESSVWRDRQLWRYSGCQGLLNDG